MLSAQVSSAQLVEPIATSKPPVTTGRLPQRICEAASFVMRDASQRDQLCIHAGFLQYAMRALERLLQAERLLAIHRVTAVPYFPYSLSMSKAFTKESDSTDGEVEEADALPLHVKNYVTPAGLAALREELRKLRYEERPKVVETVSWAAGNGDRSENGDYLYGKKRLREIDSRVRYLTKRVESAEMVDPERQKNRDQVFFGATVEYERRDNTRQKVTIVGIDEADLAKGKISWLSPFARALMKAHAGDVIEFRTPSGQETVEVVSIAYGSAP
jgi:transcription elongation factor GreB